MTHVSVLSKNYSYTKKSRFSSWTSSDDQETRQANQHYNPLTMQPYEVTGTAVVVVLSFTGFVITFSVILMAASGSSNVVKLILVDLMTMTHFFVPLTTLLVNPDLRKFFFSKFIKSAW